MIPTHTSHITYGRVTHSVIDLGITSPRTATLFTQYVADDTLFSDHFPIHYQLEVPSGQANFNFLPRWNFSRANWTSFQNHINASLRTPLPPPPDINSFLNIILASASENIPQTRPRSDHRNVPWWNSECQRAVALRRRAMRAFRRCICQEHDEQARRARFEAKQIILKAKTDGWQTFSSNFNRFTPLSKIWSMIKCFSTKSKNSYKIPHLNINNTHYLVPYEVATQFAQHYATISTSEQYSDNITTTLDNTLATLSFHSDNTEHYNALFTEHELQHAIQKCGNTSVGPDQIAYPFFKNLPESGLKTLLDLLNQLWENNSFPSSWHSSTLIPILKPRKLPSDPSSYRPISLTSCASKLIERMVNGRIRTYLEPKLSPHQNGFRPGRSTAEGIVQIIHSVQRGFQKQSYTIAVFLDLKNAFDKVNKTAVKIKIHNIGLRGRMVNFIDNFLTDRTFQVRCGNTYSATFKQDHGLPQGSVISPTLFLIMINDIFENISDPNIKYSLYADDVAFWTTHHDIDQAYNNIKTTLDKIQEWCEKWGLIISPNKSAAIVFSHRIPRCMPPELKVHNDNIPYVEHFKYLGITLDNKLNFETHFQDLTQRCARRINILKCIACKNWGADRQTLFRLYTSLIRPILDYNCFLYDDTATKKIDSLQTIQNHALRIITGAFRTSPIMNLHIEANIPLLDRRRKFLLLRFFARSLAKPHYPTFQILNTPRNNGILTDAERKHRTINQRIGKVLEHFELEPFNIMPDPPIAPYWLVPAVVIEYLFTSKKQTTTLTEIKQLFLEYQNKFNQHTFIYTDGSKSDGRTGAGISTLHINKSNRLHDFHSIYTAELWAILEVIRIIQNENMRKAIICSDSASSLQAISSRNPITNPIIYQIIGTLQQLSHCDIRFLWVPGHTGIRGNEAADKLAKDSLQYPPRNDLPCPLPDILNQIHNQLQTLRQFDWNTNPHHHLYNIKPQITHFNTSNQNTRLKETVLARLRVGHTRLTHIFIIEHRPPPTCHKCNNTVQYTIQHFLIDCPHLQQHRQSLTQYINRHKLAFNLKTILGDENPELIDLLFDFLTNSRIINNI